MFRWFELNVSAEILSAIHYLLKSQIIPYKLLLNYISQAVSFQFLLTFENIKEWPSLRMSRMATDKVYLDSNLRLMQCERRWLLVFTMSNCCMSFKPATFVKSGMS